MILKMIGGTMLQDSIASVVSDYGNVVSVSYVSLASIYGKKENVFTASY